MRGFGDRPLGSLSLRCRDCSALGQLKVRPPAKSLRSNQGRGFGCIRSKSPVANARGRWNHAALGPPEE